VPEQDDKTAVYQMNGRVQNVQLQAAQRRRKDVGLRFSALHITETLSELSVAPAEVDTLDVFLA
jgi:hypothetical protein